ncbi:MAG: hypothetical protein ACPGXL_03290 [Chitinophagales bacterium]
MSKNGDTLVNGIIAGLTMPVIAYGILQGIESLLPYITQLPSDWEGFSDRLTYMICLVANSLPIMIFNRQERTRSVQGVVGMTLIFAFIILFYFRENFA